MYFFSDLKKEEKEKTYDSEIIYSFKISDVNIKVKNIDEKGVFVYIYNNKKLNISSETAILIGDICKKRCK